MGGVFYFCIELNAMDMEVGLYWEDLCFIYRIDRNA